MFREKLYQYRHRKEVLHTTWNPGTERVMRIHLIPPRFRWRENPPSLLILNGKDTLPLNPSWSILLSELIRAINQGQDGADGGRSTERAGEVTEETQEAEFSKILDRAFRRVQRVYPGLSRRKLSGDFLTMMDTLEAIRDGREPGLTIGSLSMEKYMDCMRAPLRMDLMVSAMRRGGSWNCNQRCLHCYAAGQPEAETEELTTAQWKRVIDMLRECGVTQLTFTGGEPTMRQDVPELIRYARWCITRLNTNGVRLTEDYCRELSASEVDNVQITFYSWDPAVHNALVGAERFKDTVTGIQNALKAGISISTNTPLCSLNRDYEETLAFLYELGIRYVTVSGLIVTGNARSAESHEKTLSSQELREVLERACDFVYGHGMEFSFTSPGLIPEEELRRFALDVPGCGAALSNMAIAPNGDVVPCQSWLSGECLGNILTDSWKSIWEHPRSIRIRKHSAGDSLYCPLSRDGKGVE